MALAMKPECERCGASLDHAAEAYACSFECTFCPDCMGALAGACPNCGGELLRRPRRGVPAPGPVAPLGWAKRFDDIAAGDRMAAGESTLGLADIVDFARRWDPQPYHLDPAAAARSMFGAQVASGWQTTAATMANMVRAQPLGDTPLLGLGVDALRWPRATMPGDTLTTTIDVLETTPSRSRPDRGTIRNAVTTVNQRGEPVLTMTTTLLVPRG